VQVSDSWRTYLEPVVLLSRAGVSSRLKEPRSTLAGVDVVGLFLFRLLLPADDRKLDSVHDSRVYFMRTFYRFTKHK
jgi:hypothetical protein